MSSCAIRRIAYVFFYFFFLSELTVRDARHVSSAYAAAVFIMS